MSKSEITNLKSSQYNEFINVLNKGRHPGFVGKEQYKRSSSQGGAFGLYRDGVLCCVALVNTRTNNLNVLNTLPEYRGKGVGLEMMRFIKCNFVRAIESAVKFFLKCGYVCLGDYKQGKRHKVFIMCRKELVTLYKRVKHG